MEAAGVAIETWRVMALPLGLDEDDALLRDRAAEQAGIDPGEIRAMRIARKSVDARKQRGRRRVRFVVHVDLDLPAGVAALAGETFARACRAGRVVQQHAKEGFEVAEAVRPPGAERVVVVGAGPAGLFAALALARNGVGVDVVDRGPDLAERGRAVARFVRTREPDPEANLLFGAGGAGTYSDGKLYTRVDHPLEGAILDELVTCGAPPEIAWDARAHIGTDVLHRVLPRLQARLEALGVRFHWRVRVEGLERDPGAPERVRALRTSRGDWPCAAVVLALGHSARDTFELLRTAGLVFASKPFQLGVRIEHPQALIDRGRYGERDVVEKLGHAYYALSAKPGAGAAGAHSFCMCPGGQIVGTVNVPGLLCTNGMSNSRHSSPWANAGIVTTLGPAEFGPDAFDGLRFQADLEARFFDAGGADYTAPAQRADDFIAGRESAGELSSSYKLGTRPGRIDALLPERVREAIRHALVGFDRAIPGFAGPQGLLVGIESRSSAPIRMPRDEATRLAEGFANVYPAGEGAGYAGGIMSAAIDGARSARALLGVRERRRRGDD
jgi:uncharacterized FAD-dependent dehydrogenase